jgi:3-deoxy-D-manno-octulosonate 8-phosphate phosphatase (KDO 8-P phosphatase)
MDCDGVLTDGRLYFSASGEAMKAFDVRDGQGIALWHSAGFDSGIISGRDSGGIVAARANELGIKYVREGSNDKVVDFREIIAQANVSPEDVVYIGDDIGDIELMRLVGLSVAVADAVNAVKEVARHTTIKSGGRGAVRELIDLIFESKRK